MDKIKMKPTAILCADLHFREDQPICRKDDFWETQIKKMQWLNKLQQEMDCPVWCAGDYFHHWKPSPRLLSACIKYMPYVYAIPGNHDLPSHNLKLIEKSGLCTMANAKKVFLLPTGMGNQDYWIEPFPYGSRVHELPEGSEDVPHVAIVHKLIEHPQAGTTAKGLINKMEGYNLILTGDNHQPFEELHKGTALINPGSFSRQKADEDHTPSVVLWYSKNKSFEKMFKRIYIPCDKQVISRAHLQVKEQKEERYNLFIDRLNDNYEIGLSFKNNMKKYFEFNRTRKKVTEMINESMEA